ncbi:uncharacterized protein LY89DRAFT_684887 [Mollisia scopiformis]|uniref:LysM domain-containing protein n=1 Tax=Mollisia scopiformis TaxID=149040 RepID=A0A194X9L8_MOLSC|nr:uncharacterized protein LY89DRAFT_684887 [Mollisia scopiformis]KUJ16861.1 hypothetical protein LY89DRAFT_684887 [Mollisia scopiformis]
MIPSRPPSETNTDAARNSSVPRIAGGGDSSIRPRNRRLISTEQELVSTSATSTPGGSRAVSPLPAKHPSRSVPRNAGGRADKNGNGGLLAPSGSSSRKGGGSLVGGKGLWDPPGWMSSWNALQGLASSVLGGEAEDPVTGRAGTATGKKPRREGAGRKKIPEQWGPPEPATQRQKDGGIGWGSTEEMQAEVRARKMRGVLEGREEERSILDTNGNYKRRSSTEEQRPGSSQEDDFALVYIHHVQKQDTLQGVVLKYNCKPEVFRKANRLWPNDTIQIRETVILPVDACAVKGRPCEAPSLDQGVDLLAPTPVTEDPFSNGGTWPGASSPYNNGTSAERPEDNDNPWVHVRWVLLDASPNAKPVEIARMPRKTLGYFPPRRRKSQATISTVSTPRGSTEFPRIAQTISNDLPGSTSSTPRRTSNLGPRPSQPVTTVGSYFPPQRSSTRPRRESVGEAADRLGWMRGPGGVGTFATNVRRPGPAQDGLNAWAKKHIPGLAIDGMSSSSILGAETAHFGFGDELASIAEGPGTVNGAAVTNSGIGNLTPGGLGLENAAAAIEGWVRRLATKTPGTPKGGGRIDAPDLIELLDGTGSDDGRGFELSPGRIRSSTPIGTGREDLDGVIRGRATAGAKGGKSD